MQDAQLETVTGLATFSITMTASGGMLVTASGAGGATVNLTKGYGQLYSQATKVRADTVFNGAIKWLGPSYKEIYPGIFRSADGLRQFRMVPADLNFQGKLGAHMHMESLNAAGQVIENIHIPIY